MDALAAGVYAADPRVLSARSTFSFLYEYEQKHGSIVLGAVMEWLRGGAPGPRQQHPLMHKVSRTYSMK